MPPAKREHSLVSGGVFLTVGAIVQAVAGLGAQLVLMRLLLPEEFGDFAIVLASAGLAQIVLSLRLHVLIIRLSDAELTETRRECYQAALVWETAAAAAVTLIGLAAAGLLSAYAMIMVAALAVAQWTNQSAAFFERTLAYRRIVAVETASQIVGHLAAVALVLIGFGAASLYLRELIAALARLGAFGWIGALSWPRCRLPRWPELRALAIEARGLWADGVMESGFVRIIVLAAAGLTNPHGAGIFAQSQRLAIIPHQILAPVVIRLSTNLFSRIDDARARRRLLVQMMLAVLASMALTAGLAAAFADPLVPMVLGEHWRPAATTLAAMAGVIVFYPGFELLRVYCATQRRMRLVLLGRSLQYLIFLAGCAIAAQADDPVLILSGALSLSYAGAFTLIAAGLALTPPASVPSGTPVPSDRELL